MSKLTEQIKAKYPQYANVPDAQLESRILAKYPQYKPLASKSVGGFAYNVGKSAVRSLGDLMGAVVNVANPNMGKNTVANIAKLAAGTAQYLDPTQLLGTQFEDSARAVGNFYKDRYGGLDKIGNTLYNDPVGAALDVAAVATGAGGALKGTASVAGKLGSLNTATKLAKAGNAFTKAAGFADPFSLAGKGFGKVVNAGRSKLATGFDKASERIITQGMGNPKMLDKARGVSPVPLNKLFKKYDTFDRSAETFGQAADTAGDAVKAMIAEASAKGVTVDLLSVIKLFDDEIAKLQIKAGRSDKAAASLSELQRRKQMFVDALTEQNGGLSTPLRADVGQVYGIKSDFQGDVPPNTYGMPTQDIGKTAGTTKAYKTLLRGVESAAPGIKATGREQSALIKLKEIATAAESRGSARQPVNFTKLGTAGVGSVLAGLPGAVAGIAAEQLANSPQGVKAMSQGLSGAAKVLRNPGINQSFGHMGRIISPGYNAARIGRMANQTKTPTLSNQRPQAQGVSNPTVRQPQQLSQPSQRTTYTPTPKLQPYQMPKQSKSAQAFSGNVKLKRGSFY